MSVKNIRSALSGDMRIKMSLFIVKWAASYWQTTADKHKHNDMDENSYMNI
jgi:hypothetical protein